MVGSVNIVAAPEPAHRRTAQTSKPAPAPTNRDETAALSKPRLDSDDGVSLATPERLGYAKLAQLSCVLTNLASDRTSARDMAARVLQQAEQKLRRLKAEALTAASSGDRKAAAEIARDLAKVAQEIADAARDYAAAGGEAVLTAASLADAGIALGAAPGQDASETPKAAGPAQVDAGAAAQPGGADSEIPQAAADAPSTEPAATDNDDQLYRDALPRAGSGGHAEDTVEDNARTLLDEARALIRLMKRVQRDPSAQGEAPGPTIGTGLGVLVVRPPVQRQPRG